MEPDLAIELWDDVCYPMMLASGQAPDLALIMQLRAARPDIYIDDFRDELPAVLLSTTFISGLRSEGKGVVSGVVRGALLRLYRYLGARTGEPVGRVFVVHAGSLALLDAVLPADLTLPKLTKVLCAGKGTLEDLCRLGRKALTSGPRDVVVAEALDAGLALLHAAPPPPQVGDDDDDDDLGDDVEDDDEEADDDRDDDDDDDEDEEAVGDDEEDSEEDDDVAPSAPAPHEAYLHTLQRALAAIAVDETVADPALRAERLEAIQAFNPLGSRIPTIEEARRMQDRVDLNSEGRRRALEGGGGGGRGAPRATSAGAGRTGMSRSPAPSSGGGGSGGGGGGSTVSIIRPGDGAKKTGSKPASASGTPVTSAAAAGGGAESGGIDAAGSEAAATDPDGGAEPVDTDATPAADDDGKLPAPTVIRSDLDDTVAIVATGLTAVRELDERVWLLFAEAEHELEDPRSLAQDLATAESVAEAAGKALRAAASQQRVRGVLELQPDRRLNERRFDLEADAWLNTIANYRRSYDPDSRQLISLPNVLDHAAGALVRIEALRAAVELVAEAEIPENVLLEDVSQRYEWLLSEITYLANGDIIAAARERADADAATVLVAGGACESVDAFTSAAEETSLDFDPPAQDEQSTALPDKLSDDSALGEIVDAVRVHVLRAAWAVLRSPHRPEETATQLDVDLRRVLRAYARITPRRERHQRNPRVALPVASLERLTGKAEMAQFFVRLSTDGKLLFLEDYEDGSYIDVFELRENQKRQMHARAKERASESRTGELQTGSSYLHTVGRSNDPFGTERDMLAACVVDDDGEITIFDPF